MSTQEVSQVMVHVLGCNWEHNVKLYSVHVYAWTRNNPLVMYRHNGPAPGGSLHSECMLRMTDYVGFKARVLSTGIDLNHWHLAEFTHDDEQDDWEPQTEPYEVAHGPRGY